MGLYCLKILLAFYSFGVGVGRRSGAVTVFPSVLIATSPFTRQEKGNRCDRSYLDLHTIYS